MYAVSIKNVQILTKTCKPIICVNPKKKNGTFGCLSWTFLLLSSLIVLQLDGRKKGRQIKTDKVELKQPQPKKKNLGMWYMY